MSNIFNEKLHIIKVTLQTNKFVMIILMSYCKK
jgi:hypothetical protein